MAQGYLNKIIEKSVKGGAMTMYDLSFSDGNVVGAGKFKPKFAVEGKYYQYEFTQNGNFKNLTAGSMKEIAAPAGTTAAAAAAATPAPKGYGKSDETQKIIQRQAAANTAIAFVKLLAETDSLPVPKTAAKDKKADLMETVLKDYMNKIHMWNTHEPYDFGKEADDSDPFDLASMEDKDMWSE
jgi:hypothetical protein